MRQPAVHDSGDAREFTLSLVGRPLPEVVPESYARTYDHRAVWYVGLVPQGNWGDYIYCVTGERWAEALDGNVQVFPVSHEYRPGEGLPDDLWWLGPDLWPIETIGAQRASSEALYRATGWDLRRRHLTQGLIVRTSGPGWGASCRRGTGLVHIDEQPVLGTRTRILDRARQMSTRLGVPLWYESRTMHGGEYSGVIPVETYSESPASNA